MLLNDLLGADSRHFWFGFIVFGIVIAAVLSVVFATLTLPTVLWVARAGQWGRLRSATIVLSAAAVAGLSLVLVPVGSGAGEPTLSNLLLGAMWFWVGPASWAAAILWDVTRRLPHTTNR